MSLEAPCYSDRHVPVWSPIEGHKWKFGERFFSGRHSPKNVHKKKMVCFCSCMAMNVSRQPIFPPLSQSPRSVNGHVILSAAVIMCAYCSWPPWMRHFVVIQSHHKLIYAMHQAMRDLPWCTRKNKIIEVKGCKWRKRKELNRIAFVLLFNKQCIEFQKCQSSKSMPET